MVGYTGTGYTDNAVIKLTTWIGGSVTTILHYDQQNRLTSLAHRTEKDGPVRMAVVLVYFCGMTTYPRWAIPGWFREEVMDHKDESTACHIR